MDVARYLREFLGDPRVIDIPTIPRKLLVNGIIVPFRAPKSAKILVVFEPINETVNVG
jgi:ferrochelatase